VKSLHATIVASVATLVPAIAMAHPGHVHPAGVTVHPTAEMVIAACVIAAGAVIWRLKSSK